MTTPTRRRTSGRVTPRKPRPVQTEADRLHAQPAPTPTLAPVPNSIEEAEAEITSMEQQINSTAQAIQNAQQQILMGQQRIAYLNRFIAACKQGSNGKVQA